MVEVAEVYSGEIFSSVIIDGNNIVTEGTKEENGQKIYIFRLERLKNTIQKVEQLGWPTKTVLKKRTYEYCMKETSTLTKNQRESMKKMVAIGMIHLIEYNRDKDIDDKVMIQHALDHDSWILTEDSFRKDHLPKLKEAGKFHEINEINKRKVKITFGPDHQPIFCLPQNQSALDATKVVSDTESIDSTGDGCALILKTDYANDIHFTLPMRKPVGRALLLDLSKESIHKESVGIVSRSLLRFDWDGSNYYVTDVNSKNGTKINDLKIPPHQPQKIISSDIISIGKLSITLD